jgi:rod shape determining protein RodA
VRGNNIIWKDLDWISIAMFGVLMLFGWLNIYAAIYDDPQMMEGMNIFYGKSGKQFLWICVAIIIAIGILIIDFKFFFSVPYVFYVFMMIALVGVLIVGVKINGSRAWYDLGPIRIQPAEFTKYALALGLTKFISDRTLKYDISKDTMILAGMILLPSVLIILENETGSILVFESLIIVFYRDGLNSVIPALGLSMVTLFVCTLLFSWYPVVITLAVLGGIAILLAPKTKQTFFPENRGDGKALLFRSRRILR